MDVSTIKSVLDLVANNGLAIFLVIYFVVKLNKGLNQLIDINKVNIEDNKQSSEHIEQLLARMEQLLNLLINKKN